MISDKNLIFDVQTFIMQIKDSGYTNLEIADQFVAWVVANTPCECIDKKLKKDALLLFQTPNAVQFELYYQVKVNKLFLIIKMDKKSLLEEIDKSIIPLFDDSYRKLFIKNKKKRTLPWIDIEQLKRPDVFYAITKLIVDFYIGGSNVAVSDEKQDESDEIPDVFPSKEDFESAYRMLTRPGESISIDSVLNQLEINAKNEGHLLKSDWRMVTEKNIEIWSK